MMTKMTSKRYAIQLAGCSPVPLAHYLKALGILRLVSEQVDSKAQGWWQDDTFWLRSTLDEEGLVEFFLERYEPTPIVAPWNGGSGFFPNDNKEAISVLQNSKAIRFAKYGNLINLCHQLLSELRLIEKPEKINKPKLLQLCRNRFPDDSLTSLDAAFLLTENGPKYPPLLGTGWNDGRLEFTNNYMQRICDLFDCVTGTALSETTSILRDSLFDLLSTGRTSSPIGQFDPGSAGGANSNSSMTSSSTVNTWDYILMLEGAIVFASASVKQLKEAEQGALAYPFCVRSTGVGYSSAGTADESDSRNEMWMPLWDSATTFNELTTLLSEGRVEIGGQSPRNSVEFSRAISSLGTDRGIDSFQRYGFLLRNGLAYFAVPLSRFEVHANPTVEELLAPLDHWLDRFRRVAKDEKKSPASARRALRKIETAILNLCQRGDRQDVQNILVALGEAESVIAKSSKLRGEVNPIPPLSSDWLEQSYLGEHDIEFRLAASLASLYHEKVGPLRRHFEPLEQQKGDKPFDSKYLKWNDSRSDPNIVWGRGDLIQNMIAVLNRRMIEVLKQGKQKGDDELFAPVAGRCSASMGDIAAFVAGDVDDKRIATLLRGLILINWKFAKWDHIKI
ncbi:CRISPR-associated protein Csx17, partial [hydrothermal vent metagenome]